MNDIKQALDALDRQAAITDAESEVLKQEIARAIERARCARREADRVRSRLAGIAGSR